MSVGVCAPPRGRDEWGSARRILCVRLDGLGDLLMTTPALRALQQGASRRSLTLLASRAGARAVPLIPELDDVVEFEAPWMKAGCARPEADAALLEKLRAGRFDAAVIFTVYSQNPLPAAYVCYLAGIPLRLAHCRENPYHLLTHWVKEREPAQLIRHEVRRQLDLVGEVGCRTADEGLSIRIPAPARASAERLLVSMGIGGRPMVVIHPGASAPSRRWPPGHFAVAARLIAQEGFEVVFTGSADEATLVAEIQAAMGLPSHSAAGRLDLAGLGALIARARVFVTNNTGPAHVAAAVGTPVVDLYALTNPQHTPWQVEHRVLFHDVPCKFCYRSECPLGHHDCLRRVGPEQVAAAVLELDAQAPPLRRGTPAVVPILAGAAR